MEETAKIRIKSKTGGKINYINGEFIETVGLASSYKNTEVSEQVGEKLFLTVQASRNLLTIIEWGLETPNNTVEQAGLLIGNRHRDSSGVVWGKVMNVIPLHHTIANKKAITMTSDSFFEATVQEFPLLQNNDPNLEIIGWYHTHTYSDQPVFSETDYRTQSTTFASYKSWFALVLNAQQRTFSGYYGVRGDLIKTYMDAESLAFNLEINNEYLGSKQNFKIKQGCVDNSRDSDKFQNQIKIPFSITKTRFQIKKSNCKGLKNSPAVRERITSYNTVMSQKNLSLMISDAFVSIRGCNCKSCILCAYEKVQRDLEKSNITSMKDERLKIIVIGNVRIVARNAHK